MNLRAYLELASAMAILGSSIVVGKLVIASLPVFLVSGLRFAIASAILLPLLIVVENGISAISKKDLFISFQAFAGERGCPLPTSHDSPLAATSVTGRFT